MSPLVSVLMPVYNERPQYLERSLASICDQSMKDFELLLVDDGSDSHDTIDVMERCASNDSRVRLIRCEHGGITATLNKGLMSCRCELISRHDSDDWSDPDRFAQQLDFLDRHPDYALVGSQAWLHQEDGTLLWATRLPTAPADILIEFARSNPFIHGATMFRRAAAHDIGGYHTALDSSEDYDFFWRMCERYGGGNLPRPLYHHRRTAGSISTQRAVKQALAAHRTRVLAQLRAQGVSDAVAALSVQSEPDFAPQFFIRSLFMQADGLLIAGHYRRALAEYIRGLARTPASPVGYLKLGRWVLFIAFPLLRRRLFSWRASN